MWIILPAGVVDHLMGVGMKHALLLSMILVAGCSKSPQSDQQVAKGSAPVAVTPAKPTDLTYRQKLGHSTGHWKADSDLLEYPDLLRALRKQGISSVRFTEDECADSSWGASCSKEAEDELTFAGRTIVSVKTTEDEDLGGAHPAGGVSDFLWDRVENKRLLFGNIFTSWSAVRPILQAKLCQGIKDEFSKRETPGDPSEAGDDPQCPNVQDVALTLSRAESGNQSDLIWADTSDYQLGSYAAARVTVGIDIDQSIYNLIKPQYRADFVKPE